MFKMPSCLSRKDLFYESFPIKHILKRIKQDMKDYMRSFSTVLRSHLSTEFEIPIMNNQITDVGNQTLSKLENDYNILQLEENIKGLIFKNRRKVSGSNSIILDLLDIVEEDLLISAQEYVSVVRKSILRDRRKINNDLCKDKCNGDSRVFNFTEINIPKGLLFQLEVGLNNVPQIEPCLNNLKTELINEALSYCKELYKSSYGVYPRTCKKSSFDNNLLSILSQCVSNSIIVDEILLFRQLFVESLPCFMSMIRSKGYNTKDLISLIPQGCIITMSDKNVGVSILPPQWYAQEYNNQIIKGGHQSVNMSEAECITFLCNRIHKFRISCSSLQKTLVNSLWPKEYFGNHRIGVMKLIPKVHKLKGPINKESWKQLPSRPIRGAESDPIRFPSKVLFHLLKNMLSDLQEMYDSINIRPLDFPILKGCDDYINRLKKIRLLSKDHMQTVLVTADFTDAYTETGIDRLKTSIRLIGDLVKTPNYIIDLILKLVNLVFDNCYFFTPYGLFKQTRGMPMGDYSSR